MKGVGDGEGGVEEGGYVGSNGGEKCGDVGSGRDGGGGGRG